jgi:hypothetical protein
MQNKTLSQMNKERTLNWKKYITNLNSFSNEELGEAIKKAKRERKINDRKNKQRRKTCIINKENLL